MRPPVCMLCLLAFVVGCAHDHFALIDRNTGREVGRFAYRTGEELALDGKTYQIRRIGSHRSAAEQFLKMTIVPDVDMCYANVYDVVAYLNDCIVEFGPTNVTWTTPLPNIQIQGDTDVTPAPPWITIAGVQDISVYECLRRVCRQGGFRLVIDDQHVWLKRRRRTAQPSPRGDSKRAADDPFGTPQE